MVEKLNISTTKDVCPQIFQDARLRAHELHTLRRADEDYPPKVHEWCLDRFLGRSDERYVATGMFLLPREALLSDELPMALKAYLRGHVRRLGSGPGCFCPIDEGGRVRQAFSDVVQAVSVLSKVLGVRSETVELGVCPPSPAVVFSELLDSAHLLMLRASSVSIAEP